MGLTIHYSLKHDGTDENAHSLVQQLHQAAQDLPFKEVQNLVDLKGNACEFEKRDREDPLRWLLIQADGSFKLDEHTYISVPPTRIIAFETWPGEGCEAANFGLCQYPASIKYRGKPVPTKMKGWRWSSFCKTQYASDPACGGVENFIRSHLLVVAMLDRAKELGCLEEVCDEGKFWDNRDVKALVPEVASWNSMIAALAGQLKDALGDGVESPITDFSNFEQLELAGQSTLTPQTAQLAKLIQQVIKKP
jgi:hypothetical protein